MTTASRPTPVHPDWGAALAAVERRAFRTPLVPDRSLSEALGRDVWIKAECLQRTGSFKIRGAAARIEALTPSEAERGVVACSSGNHGKAIATAAADAGVPAVVYVPEWVDPVKLAGIEAAGAEARLHGATFDEAEEEAIRFARESGRTWVSAYDDPWVIRGQGTIGREIVDDLGGVVPAVIMAALSGGGLIGGIASLFHESGGKRPHLVAVSARNAGVMRASLDAGKPVELPEEETLANALAGGIGLDNRHSFALIRDLVGTHVSVSESEIAAAMRYAVSRLRLVAEGGGAVALAALLTLVDVSAAGGAERTDPADIEREERAGIEREPPADIEREDPTEIERLSALLDRLPDGPIVVVVSGGNIAPEALAAVLDAGSPGPSG